MDFYDDPNNVQIYLDMADGYDGRFLVEKLKEHLAAESSVLELGMGPGKDQLMLRESFKATGSDRSHVFVDLFKAQYGGDHLLVLDAVDINTDASFDGLYSNKVLQHLSSEEFIKSIERQYDLLNEGGILIHSFWAGEGEAFYDGLRFVYYTEATLKKAFENKFEIIEMAHYKEEEAKDSIYIIAKKPL